MSQPDSFLLARTTRLGEATLEVRSPWDGQTVSRVSLADREDGLEAAQAAWQAAGEFARTSTDERRGVLEGISRGLAEQAPAFAEVICHEAGKPIALARAEVQRAVETFHLAAGEAERLVGQILPVDLSPGTRGYRCLVTRVPRGPTLAIGPFNFPLNLLAHKVAPALAVGAPVVIKPPPQAPSAALMLGRLICEVAPPHWPDGFLSVLPCTNEVADSLVRDDRFAVVSFTGSAAVGWKLREVAGHKHVVLELGGDSAVIVAEDADLEAAAKRIAWGAVAYAGQICISVQRVFVQEQKKERFIRLLADAMAAAPVGDPADQSTLVGPVIDDRAAERIEQTIHGAGQEGRLVIGGSRKGRLVSPALIDEPEEHGALGCEEVFGPVAAVWGYNHFHEAIERVNRSRYGLQAALYTHDVRRIFEAYEQLRVGGLVVNDIPTLRVDNYPYGGTKHSGLGREGGRSGVEELTEPRVLVLNPQ